MHIPHAVHMPIKNVSNIDLRYAQHPLPNLYMHVRIYMYIYTFHTQFICRRMSLILTSLPLCVQISGMLNTLFLICICVCVCVCVKISGMLNTLYLICICVCVCVCVYRLAACSTPSTWILPAVSCDLCMYECMFTCMYVCMYVYLDYTCGEL